MKFIKKHCELPEDLKSSFSSSNVFYTENYESYVRKNGAECWYAISDKLALVIVVYKKAFLKYAALPSEYQKIVFDVDSKEIIVFLNQISKDLKKCGVAWVASSATALFECFPDNSYRIPFGSHLIDLENDEETILANMHSKHRNVVKRAERCGVIVKNGGLELLHDYILMDEMTWARSGKNSYGIEYFQLILDELKDNAIIYIAYMNNEPQAGACYYYNKEMCYYMFGVSVDKPETGATNFLHWRALCDMKNRGVKKYSFVGCRIDEDENSKYHTIQRFKERFGGELKQGYMFKSILIPWKYSLFHILYKIKNGRDLVDAIDEELPKWSDLQKNDKECDKNV